MQRLCGVLSILLTLTACSATHSDRNEPNGPDGGHAGSQAGPGGEGGTQIQLDGMEWMPPSGGVGGFGQAGVSGNTVVPDEDAGTDEVVLTCEARSGDHGAADCGGAACPFIADVVLACNDWEFGAPGLRVAPTADGAKLFTSSGDRAFELTASGGDGTLRELPDAFVRCTHALAQEQDGEIVLGVPNGKVELYRHDGSAWQLADADPTPRALVRWYDLEIDALDTAHSWIEVQPVPSFEHLTRTASGEWNSEVEVPGHPGSFTRWTLTREGEPASLSMATTSGYQLEATIDGITSVLGDASENGLPAYYRPLSPAVPQAATGPQTAVVIERYETLSVAWPSDNAQGYVELDVPDTARPINTCGGIRNAGDCAVDCEDRSSGAAEYAITQSSGGTLWLAWITVHNDVLYDYEEPGACMFECYCSITAVDRGTQSTLHLARINPAAGELDEVLTMPSASIQRHNAFIPNNPDARLLDVRAFGDQLAIGLRTTAPAPAESWVAEVRLIQLDLGAL